jgi:tetratricopeptide (TPR) repeat protein
LGGLVEKSLLRSEDGGRYVWHELLRQYAEEKLHDIPGAGREALADHLRHYVGAVKGAKGQDIANRRLIQFITAEIDNIRQAWQTAVREVNYEALNELVVGLGMYYQIQALHEEGARMLQQAVSVLRGVASAPGGLSGEQQRVLGHLMAWLAWMESEPAYRFELANEAVNLLQPLGAHLQLGTALMSRGNALRMLERPGEAVPDLEEAIRLFKLIEEPFHLSGVINLLALAQGELGDFAAAEHRLREFLEMARDGGIEYVIAIALGNLAWNARRRGAYEEAEAWIAERLELNRRLGNELSTANALHTAGVIAYEQGRVAEAEALLLQAKETPDLRREAPHTWQDVMSGLTRVYLQLGEPEKARRHLIDGLESLRDDHYRGRSIDLLLALAQWVNLERPRVAVELLALADKLVGADMRPDVRRELEQITSGMSPSALQEARMRGEARKLEQTIDQFVLELRQH